MPKYGHILVMRLSAMGDVAMIVPLLRALVQQYPEVKITLISRPFFEPFFKDIPNISFFAVDLINKHKGILGLFRLFLDLTKINFDAFVDLHNVLRSKIIRIFFSIVGKKIVFVDKGRKEKKALTRSKNKVFKPLKTMLERYVSVFNQLEYKINLQNPIFPKKAILEKELIDIVGIKNEIWIGIAPFAQYESKIYPLDRMEKVIQVLAMQPNYKILFFGGGKQEIRFFEHISRKINNVFVVAGKFNLEQELKLISHLDIMLSMDSGNAHIAAMLGIRVVTLWGATHPFAGFAPFNQPIDNGLFASREKFPKLPTSIYGNKKVKGYEDVMRTIHPEDVIEKINNMLQTGRIEI